MTHQLRISHPVLRSATLSAKTPRQVSVLTGVKLTARCSNSKSSNLKKTVALLVNAFALAILPPTTPAYGFLPLQLPSLYTSPTANQLCKKNCKLNEAGYALIRTFEGYSPFVYKDAAGYPTIGYGHLILKGEKFKEPLLPLDANTLLVKDVSSKVAGVNRAVLVPLHPNQFAALTSFSFNLGLGALTKSTLLKKVNTNLHSEVPTQLNRYIYAGKVKLRGLVIRRAAEGKLYQQSN